MSLMVLVVIVVVGIAATVAAVHLTGGSKRAVIADVQQVRDLFAADFPNERATAVTVTADRQSAFLMLPGGRVGVVQSMGDGFFTRIVAARDVAAIRLREPATVSIRFRDFTWTGGHFAFSDPESARTIARALDPASV